MSDDFSAFWVISIISSLIVAALLGLVTGAIAEKKGGDFFVWWIFGTLMFIVALPMVIFVLDAKPVHDRSMGIKNCPYCSCQMKTAIMKCPDCSRAQPEIGSATHASWQKIRTADDEVAKWAKEKGLDDDTPDT